MKPSMTASTATNYLSIDQKQGVFQVSRRAFTDADVLEREQAEIFDKCWLYLGHGSELKNPGVTIKPTTGASCKI